MAKPPKLPESDYKSSAEAELTTLMDEGFGPGDSGASVGDALPTFEADNIAAPMTAEATQIVLSDEPEPEPKAGGRPVVQDLDDLFVELIEE